MEIYFRQGGQGWFINILLALIEYISGNLSLILSHIPIFIPLQKVKILRIYHFVTRRNVYILLLQHQKHFYYFHCIEGVTNCPVDNESIICCKRSNIKKKCGGKEVHITSKQFTRLHQERQNNLVSKMTYSRAKFIQKSPRTIRSCSPQPTFSF